MDDPYISMEETHGTFLDLRQRHVKWLQPLYMHLKVTCTASYTNTHVN